MRYPVKTPVKIIMLGAGGTGSYIAMHLYRLSHCLDRPVRIIIADGDSVEQKNLIRQHFTAADLGLNKARVLAERYASAFSMEAEYIPIFIEDKARLRQLIQPEQVYMKLEGGGSLRLPEMVVLISAVDNNKSRRLCNEAFYEEKDLIYIDSGNSEYSGQVVCGIRRNGRTLYKPVGYVYPDILEDADKFQSELSCAEASVSAPQTITANMTAATLVVSLLYNILVLGDNKVKMAAFSTRTVNVRSVFEPGRKRRRAA
ncbi:MAG: ThiF family adenylyltransferase [Oscillospiraceae bacterium]|jgi:molybdopterin/thiamine biosynthesis adenylyltransferase|nr:ThiF family adenylyltransferase [Oscillospiraceae bacterium]